MPSPTQHPYRYTISAINYSDAIQKIELFDHHDNKSLILKSLEILKHDHYLMSLSPEDLRKLVHGVHNDLMMMEKRGLEEVKKRYLN